MEAKLASHVITVPCIVELLQQCVWNTSELLRMNAINWRFVVICGSPIDPHCVGFNFLGTYIFTLTAQENTKKNRGGV